jgi:hypothetical protein
MRSNIATMRALTANIHSLTRRLGVSALALWIGGFGCLFGCRMSASAAGGGEMQMPATSESRQAMGHGCCHAGKKDQHAASASLDVNTTLDAEASPCPFSTPAADSGRKVGIESVAAIPAQQARPPAPPAHVLFDPPVNRARPPDRGGTYLRCCVFLI